MLCNSEIERAVAATYPNPRDTSSVAGVEDLSNSRFFAEIFQILLPAVLSGLPQIIQAFREGPTDAVELIVGDTPNARFLPALLGALGPVLSAVIPVLVQHILSTSRNMPDQAAGASFDQELDTVAPDLLGAIVPPLVHAVHQAVADMAALEEGSEGGARLVGSRSTSTFLATVLQAMVPAITTLLPQLFAVIAGGDAGESRGGVGITWDDLRLGRQLINGNQRDTVRFKLSKLDDPDAMELGVQLGGRVTWAKFIQLRDSTDNVVKEAGPNGVFRLDADEVTDFMEGGGTVVFRKPGFLGVHFDAYQIPFAALNPLKGFRGVARWIAD